MRVIDKTGNVYTNTGLYPMLDTLSGHVYQAGEVFKVDANAWIAGQPTIVQVKSEPTQAAKPAQVKPETKA